MGLKQSQYVRVKIDCVMRVKEVQPTVAIKGSGSEMLTTLLDLLQAFGEKHIKDAEMLLPGAKLALIVVPKPKKEE